MSLPSFVKERNFANVRKKSRRPTQETGRIPLEEDNDDCKRLYYWLQKYCEDTVCPIFPDVIVYLVRDDQQNIMVDYHINPTDHLRNITVKPKLIAYMDDNMKLRSLVCKCPDIFNQTMFLVVNQTYQHFPHLSILKLDYCNLTMDQFQILQNYLNLRKNIMELSLIGNPHPEQSFYKLLGCGLKVLNLKFCEINQYGLKKLANEFFNISPKKATLIHLDLACNPVFDNGCIYLAKIIRCDRTLRSLNLTDCKIRDEGFQKLVNSFITFALDESELILRRRIRFQFFKWLQKGGSCQNAPNNGNTIFSNDDSTIEEILKSHPFTSDAHPDRNEIFCKGNYTLESLNLSFNHLTKSSSDILLRIIMEQGALFGADKGIQRVVLDGINRETADEQAAIETLLKLRSKSATEQSVKSMRSSLKRSSKSSATGSISSKAKEGSNIMIQ